MDTDRNLLFGVLALQAGLIEAPQFVEACLLRATRKQERPADAGHATLGARFLQEARITGQLEPPGVVPVYELARARDGRQPFYAMRFVKGRTLSEAARAYHDQRRAGRADVLGLPALLNA